jgi:hypothetical protein
MRRAPRVAADFRASAADLAAAIERELADSARLASCRQYVTQLASHPGLEQAIAAIEALATRARAREVASVATEWQMKDMQPLRY